MTRRGKNGVVIWPECTHHYAGACVDCERRAAQKDARSARSTLKRIAAAMSCDPDDDDDLVEAVRLLVEERDAARALWERT